MKVKTLSGIEVEANERDSQWIKWLKKHRAGDGSISKFLQQHPPIGSTVEASDGDK